MTPATCGACRFFNPVAIVRNGIPADLAVKPSTAPSAGECRRFPPRMVGPAERLSPGYSRVPIAEFPVLDGSNWCGEFAAAESSA